MRQIVLNLDDEAFEPFMGMLRLCSKIEMVGESKVDDVLKGVWRGKDGGDGNNQ